MNQAGDQIVGGTVSAREMICGVIASVGGQLVAEVGMGEDGLSAALAERVDGAIAHRYGWEDEPGPDSFDAVVIMPDKDREKMLELLRRWWPRVRAGGVLAGLNFNHKWPGVERALAEMFDLMDVGVGPDSAWFMVKTHE